MWASCVCNAWADEPRFNQNQTGTTNTQSTTAQALYKNSLYKKMRGWIFLPHICFVEYIYICKWKIRNWGTLEFLRLNKLDVCEGAPLRPCSIFLTMKWFIKTRFYSEREMEPASLATKYPPKWTLHNHPRVEPLHGDQVRWQQLRPDTSQTHCRSSVPLARVAFAYLALPCLCCRFATR